jgi:hypothetical protein
LRYAPTAPAPTKPKPPPAVSGVIAKPTIAVPMAKAQPQLPPLIFSKLCTFFIVFFKNSCVNNCETSIQIFIKNMELEMGKLELAAKK